MHRNIVPWVSGQDVGPGDRLRSRSIIGGQAFSPQRNQPPQRLVITIDGPAGVGKSTVAKQLATRLRYSYLDTGALYRAVAWKLNATGVSSSNPGALSDMLAATRI